MNKKNSGFCWHEYHDQKLSYCFDLKSRRKVIRMTKPENEVPIRLKRIKLVKGMLPEKLRKSGKEYKIAFRKYEKSNPEVDYNISIVAKFYNEIRFLLRSHRKEIEILHKKECLNCTWDGNELIF